MANIIVIVIHEECILVPGLAPVGKWGQVGRLVLHILQDFQHTPELLIKKDACYGLSLPLVQFGI